MRTDRQFFEDKGVLLSKRSKDGVNHRLHKWETRLSLPMVLSYSFPDITGNKSHNTLAGRRALGLPCDCPWDSVQPSGWRMKQVYAPFISLKDKPLPHHTSWQELVLAKADTAWAILNFVSKDHPVRISATKGRKPRPQQRNSLYPGCYSSGILISL